MDEDQLLQRIEAMALEADRRLDRICEQLDRRNQPPLPIKSRRKRLAKILKFRLLNHT